MKVSRWLTRRRRCEQTGAPGLHQRFVLHPTCLSEANITLFVRLSAPVPCAAALLDRSSWGDHFLPVSDHFLGRWMSVGVVGAREEERARPRLPVEQLAIWTFLRDCATTFSQYRADMSISVTSLLSRTYSRTLQASRHGRGLSTRRISGRLTTGDSSARSPAVDARLADAEGSRL